jgi:PAS domain S-box-containing protein
MTVTRRAGGGSRRSETPGIDARSSRPAELALGKEVQRDTETTVGRQAREALRQSEEKLRLIVESVADAIVTIDAESRIVAANGAAERLFGYPVPDLLRQPLTILMPESLRAAHTTAFRRYVESGQRRIPWANVRVRGRHRSGREIPLELSFGEFRLGTETLYTGIIRDVSERVREEAQLRRSAAERRTLEKLAELTARADAGLMLEDVLEHIFEGFRAIVPYDRIGCALVDGEGKTVRSIWSRSSSPVVRIPVGYSAPLEQSSLEQVFDSGHPRILNDLEAYLDEHPDSENTRRILAEGMRSNLTCPLIAMGRRVGFLFFSSRRPGTFSEAHIASIERIVEHLALIVEKGRLVQQLSDANREIEKRNRLLARIFGRYTSNDIVSHLLEEPRALEMGGENRRVTMLFADLCRFTPLCDEVGPQRVVSMLNIWFGAMTDLVIDHGGTIDEILGDSILVVFGAPVALEDHAHRALACAVAMQRAMPDVNRKLSRESLRTMEMSIAVHTGEVVVGNIGSARRAKYGMVGSAVNLVTRMEGYAAGGEILCSQDTLAEVGDVVDVDHVVMVAPKGRNDPVATASVRGLRVQPAGVGGEPARRAEARGAR